MILYNSVHITSNIVLHYSFINYNAIQDNVSNTLTGFLYYDLRRLFDFVIAFLLN